MSRIICGFKQDGVSSILVDGPAHKAIFGTDGVPMPVPDGAGMELIWATDGPVLSMTDVKLDMFDLNLELGATRFMHITLPPHSVVPFHRVPTILEFTTILSGAVILHAEDGSSANLGPGDALVVLGGVHSWDNPYPEPCRWTTLALGYDAGRFGDSQI